MGRTTRYSSRRCVLACVWLFTYPHAFVGEVLHAVGILTFFLSAVVNTIVPSTAAFAKGATGSNACPSGHARVTSRAVCSEAGRFLGLGDAPAIAGASPYFPAGCYQLGRTVYFNPYSVVIATNATSTPICAKDGERARGRAVCGPAAAV